MATLDTIKNILNESLDITDVTEDSTFESMGIDSLDMAELISTVEDELDIEFGEPQNLETFGQLVAYIDSL